MREDVDCRGWNIAHWDNRIKMKEKVLILTMSNREVYIQETNSYVKSNEDGH